MSAATFETSRLPRVLIVAGFSPERGAGAGALARGLLDEYPADRIAWCTLRKHVGGSTWWRPEIPRSTSPLPAVRGLQRSAVVRAVYRAIGCRIEAAIAARAALRAAETFNAELCWAILDANVLLAIDRFLGQCDVPAHVSVHDDPGVVIRMGPSALPRQRVLAALRRCLLRAKSRDCISERMADRYRRDYGVDSIVVTHGVDAETAARSAESRRRPAQRVHVAMVGAASCPPPWPQNLAEALAQLGRRSGGTATFHHFGHPLPAVTDADFRFHSFLPQREFGEFLSGVHVGYACDPITPLGREFAATSFPTKIVTYVGAAMPFVYHGPRDSTVGDFLDEYRAGVIVESLEPAALARGFHYVLTSYEPMVRECVRAARERFDLRAMRRRFLRSLAEGTEGQARSGRGMPLGVA